jgi:hypothetical protein
MKTEPTPQQEFAASGDGSSQCDRMLFALHEAGAGTWVPMPQLAKAASRGGEGTGICVSRRIYDLRKRIAADGWDIQQSSEFSDGQNHSFYRIVRKALTTDAHG